MVDFISSRVVVTSMSYKNSERNRVLNYIKKRIMMIRQAFGLLLLICVDNVINFEYTPNSFRSKCDRTRGYQQRLHNVLLEDVCNATLSNVDTC